MARLAIFLTMVVAVAAHAQAAEVPPQAEREIDHLLDYVARSDCEFYRNGKWYSAQKARAHLSRKYRYLAGRGVIQSAEDFIALGATESSRSHQPYQVRCGQETQPSATWLTGELSRYRDSGTKSDR